ncbi:serine hydrolase domain-containing protein [Kordiimonas laminariae]|uniref:serine hydrolase domain-containing protein n=1 Tax=Kordiimonas laminariae TaxID=2917717 RepID=UPI001FF512C6|nr:serine hydrolase domain-containing protein [Kordiimonas laminariae]MCK0069423.1 beta-lactamase family protein [Kordiimonas laminariae]
MINLKTAIHRMVTGGLILSSVPVYALPPTNENQAYEVPATKLERFIGDYVTNDFSGTLLIAQNGKILHAQGYGLANREQSVPNKMDTVFATNSLTQYFTATAVLKLVEQNKLSLDDTLPDFFDNVPKAKQHITVHNLLTHTPGLLGEEGLDVLEAVDESDFLEDVFARENSFNPAFFLPTFTFQPGDRQIGFDEGYNLLALIIERRSGQSFEAFLNHQLFKPAGIINTGYQIPDWKPEQLANSYVGEDGENWGNLPDRLMIQDKLPLYLQGSVGLLSSVDDLYAWHKALYAGKVLRRDLLDLLHTRHIGVTSTDESDIDYGYGIEILETWTGTPWISNPGAGSRSNNSIPAFEAKYHYFPDENIVLIYGSNGGVNREFTDKINTLVRVLLEPDYEPVLTSTNNQQ